LKDQDFLKIKLTKFNKFDSLDIVIPDTGKINDIRYLYKTMVTI